MFSFGKKVPEQHELYLTDDKSVGIIQAFNNIGKDAYDGLYRKIIETPDDKPIHLYIETHGGEAIYADKICRLISRRKHPVKAIVKKYAHSAGAVIALAAHELEINKDATLSAIDVQTPFPAKQMGVKDIGMIFDGTMEEMLNNVGTHYRGINQYYIGKMRTWIHPRHNVDLIITSMYETVVDHGELFYVEDLEKFGVQFSIME